MIEPEASMQPDERPAAGRTFAKRRATLAVGALAASCLAWFGYCGFQAHRQTRAVAAVRALGGKVGYADDLPGHGSWWHVPLFTGWFGRDFVVPVYSVQLANTKVQDDDLTCLHGLSGLSSLRLDNTAITDTGVRFLKSLTALEDLSLRSTRVTDAGIAELKGLGRLEFLYLQNTVVGDEGVDHLTQLKRLKGVNLIGSRVSAEGAQRLRSAGYAYVNR